MKFMSNVAEKVKGGNAGKLLGMIGVPVCILLIVFFVPGNKIDEFIGKPTAISVGIAVIGEPVLLAPTPRPDVRPTATVAPALPQPEAYSIDRMPESIDECDYIFELGLMTEAIAFHCTAIMNEMAEAQYVAHEPTREPQLAAWETAVEEWDRSVQK